MIERFFPTPDIPAHEVFGGIIGRSPMVRATLAATLKGIHAHGVVVGFVYGALFMLAFVFAVKWGSERSRRVP